MEARAISKFLRISPQKARQVTRLISGRPATEALANLELMPRKAARLVAKTLRSAIANAENHEQNPVDAKALKIKEAFVNEGPTMKRFRPRARGMVGRIRKRSSHVQIVVTDETK
ncbi:MAG: 50S ribosomal protein L22 [Lentisphaeria bacterium]